MPKESKSRKFYSGSGGSAITRPETENPEKTQKLVQEVRENVLGNESALTGPFGNRKMLYMDYVASGKPIKFIEDFIQE